MNNSTQLTEERLKYWLDTNQIQRERMCIALLSINRNFSDIKPRRPKGGPDGGRDIEAIYKNQYPALGAIGFRNSASDSSNDKRWIKKKFNDDLKAAKNSNPDFQAFIFFTNVDLTPKEEGELIKEAKKQGVLFVEIFHRERLRITLDSVEGFAIRFMYLGIPMSETEQMVFFNRFGTQLEELITSQFESMDKKISNLEFLQNSVKPIVNIFAYLQFKPEISNVPEKYLKALFIIDSFYAQKELIIGGYSFIDQKALASGRKNLVLTFTPFDENGNSEEFENREVFSLIERGKLVFGMIFTYGQCPFKDINQFDQSSVTISIPNELVDYIEEIGLIMNEYLVLSIKKDDMDLSYDGYLSVEFLPSQIREKFGRNSLRTIYDQYPKIQELREMGLHSWSPFRIDFIKHSPKKLSREEIEEYLDTLASG